MCVRELNNFLKSKKVHKFKRIRYAREYERNNYVDFDLNGYRYICIGKGE